MKRGVHFFIFLQDIFIYSRLVVRGQFTRWLFRKG